jgi:uncharacterized glyoxalase superfamily metalloenzyme YdcJ
VGTAEELATLRRMFAIMGMYPVSYYDLSQAGVPVHPRRFVHRRCRAGAQSVSVFTSLLRELIENRACASGPRRSSPGANLHPAVWR